MILDIRPIKIISVFPTIYFQNVGVRTKKLRYLSSPTLFSSDSGLCLTYAWIYKNVHTKIFINRLVVMFANFCGRFLSRWTVR